MISRAARVVVAGAIGAIMIGQPAFAQSSDFNSRTFFEELQARGVKTGGIDPQKFFDELAASGASASNRLDADKFFSELQARGASMPAGFDSRKFFEELAAKGAKAPDIVTPAK